MEGGRSLPELKVADLRRELEKRQKDKCGVKQVLVDRLKEALEEEGLDPLSYRFGLDSDLHRSESEAADQSSLNGEETDAEKETPVKDGLREESMNVDSVNEEQREQKKLTEESVPYVVQVGDQEEDLDYDLKPETNGHTEICASQAKSEKVASPVQPKNEADPGKDSGKKAKIGIENRRNLWVSNLPKTVKAADLKQHFSKVGKVISATVVMSTRCPDGCFGFLQMATAEDAANAARNFDATEYNGCKLTVEATERDPPALVSKITNRPGLDRTKNQTPAKTESRKRNGRRGGSRRRPYGAIKRAQIRRAILRARVRGRGEENPAPPRPSRPPRPNPRMLAYQSLRRASRLLTSSGHGVVREMHPARENVPPPRYPRPPRVRRPPARGEARYNQNANVPQPPIKRYPTPGRRESRPHMPRTEPIHRPEPRTPLSDRRRPPEPSYVDSRARQPLPPPIPRRSEPIMRKARSPIRPPREMPQFPPMEYRRPEPSPNPRSLSQLSRGARRGRPSNEMDRSFERAPSRSRPDNRPIELTRPRIEARDYERPEPRSEFGHPSRILADDNRHAMNSHGSPYGHQSRYRSPYDGRSMDNRQSSIPRSYPVSKPQLEPRHEYRAMSRSPPRSRDIALLRPYPEASPQYDQRMRRSSRDRSPIPYGGGSRPKVVEYGHRSEPRMDWVNWREHEPPVLPAPPGHTWKPAGHSFVSNYGGRGSGRRYP
ncbi:unnamed protein product [Calicophoron daubneyi]|uniref:Scaffold attachment factor B2 n=1 Tax=Calicophoron daubneyi TaxID=300641 RepID=A0AAV2T5E0_CALDB